MRKLFVLLLLPAVFVACKKDRVKGSGPIVTQDRVATNFYKVETSGSTDVFITQGTNFSVQVKGYENILPYLETKVIDGTLQIGFKSNSNVSNDNTEVHVIMPALNSVKTSGSGNVYTKGAFLGMDFFSVTTSGSGNVSIEKGKAINYKVVTSGSGDVRSMGFESNQATVDISGSGDVELTVTGKLMANIKGSGNIYYKGDAAVELKVSGSGTVIKK